MMECKKAVEEDKDTVAGERISMNSIYGERGKTGEY